MLTVLRDERELRNCVVRARGSRNVEVGADLRQLHGVQGLGCKLGVEEAQQLQGGKRR